MYVNYKKLLPDKMFNTLFSHRRCVKRHWRLVNDWWSTIKLIMRFEFQDAMEAIKSSPSKLLQKHSRPELISYIFWIIAICLEQLIIILFNLRIVILFILIAFSSSKIWFTFFSHSSLSSFDNSEVKRSWTALRSFNNIWRSLSSPSWLRTASFLSLMATFRILVKVFKTYFLSFTSSVSFVGQLKIFLILLRTDTFSVVVWVVELSIVGSKMW